MLRSLLGAAVGAPPPVYLLDFSVYKPPEELRLNEAAAKRTAAGWSVSERGSSAGAGAAWEEEGG